MSVTSSDWRCTTASENSSTCATGSAAESIWNQETNRSMFVTVGTTRFDELIDAFNGVELQQFLYKQLGYREIVFQIGRGDVIPQSRGALRFEHFSFAADLRSRIERASLVVSHAGAGTCLEVCRAPSRLVVVVNGALMHNHQSQLAEKLSERGHCVWAHCDELLAVFQSNAALLGADVSFDEAFSRFDTDYYRNVAMAIGALF